MKKNNRVISSISTKKYTFFEYTWNYFPFLAFSQLKIRADPVALSGQIIMKDAECAEMNEKRNNFFLRFLFFDYGWKLIENWLYFEYKNDH